MVGYNGIQESAFFGDVTSSACHVVAPHRPQSDATLHSHAHEFARVGLRSNQLKMGRTTMWDGAEGQTVWDQPKIEIRGKSSPKDATSTSCARQ